MNEMKLFHFYFAIELLRVKQKENFSSKKVKSHQDEFPSNPLFTSANECDTTAVNCVR